MAIGMDEPFHKANAAVNTLCARVTEGAPPEGAVVCLPEFVGGHGGGDEGRMCQVAGGA